MCVLFFLYGDNLADSLYLVDSVNDFSDETRGAAIDNFRKMIKLKDLTYIVSDEFSVIQFELFGVRLGRCQLGVVLFRRRLATHLKIYSKLESIIKGY